MSTQGKTCRANQIAYIFNNEEIKYVRSVSATGTSPADWANVIDINLPGFTQTTWNSLALVDGNPTSPTAGETVSPRDYVETVTGCYMLVP